MEAANPTPSTRPPADTDADLLRAFLLDHDAPCPRCGRGLGGLESDRCPRCRCRLVLDVQPGPRTSRAWLAGLTCLGIGAGPWTIGAGTAMLNWLADDGYRGEFYWPALVSFVIAGAVVLGWLVGRPWIESRGARTRGVLAGAACLLGPGGLVVMLLWA